LAEGREGTPDILVLDIETQYLFDEVGGRDHVERLRLALAVTYSVAGGGFESFWEPDAERLVSRLRQADLVVGFNLLAFDYRVLQAYTSVPLHSAVPTLDIMDDVRSGLGTRVSLDALARATLGAQKGGSGLDSVKWFRAGQLDLVEQYCRADVDITHRLFAFGLRHGHLLALSRDGASTRRFAVNWAARPAGALHARAAAVAAVAAAGGVVRPATGAGAPLA
jgi:DEAD/DEAH box helicase domain-containing protein